MKKIGFQVVSILLGVLVLLSLYGCGEKRSLQDTVAERYLEDAQQLIADGNYDKAIETLELGIQLTDNQVLKNYLAVLQADQDSNTSPAESQPQTEPVEIVEEPSTEPTPTVTTSTPSVSTTPNPTSPAPTTPTNSYSRYEGYWGGGLLHLKVSGSAITLSVSTPPSYFDRIDTIDKKFKLDDIHDNTVTFTFVDSWENSGTAVLTFAGDHLSFWVRNADYGDFSMCSFRNGTTNYYRSYASGVNAYSDYSEPETEPETEPVTEPETEPVTEPVITEPPTEPLEITDPPASNESAEN